MNEADGMLTRNTLLGRALTLAALTALLTGCPGSGNGADAGAPDAGSGAGDAGACTPTLAPTCGGTRWVGRKKTTGGDCPLSAASAGAGWAAQKLVLTTGMLPDALARTCVYTRASAPSASDLCTIEAELSPPSGLVSLVEECQHVYPSGFSESLAETFRSALHAQAGGVRAFTAAPSKQTRVIAVDTDPDRFDGAPEECVDSHGCTMAHLAKDLLCPQRANGPCAGQVGWAEALPHTGPDGGRYGFPSELAAGVIRAFDAWRTDLIRGNPVPAHLVFDMSLGWETNGACDEPGGPAAVADALRFVACNGSLSIAAAGNAHRGDVSPAQMACPARLETTVLTPEGCAGFVDADLLQAYETALDAPWDPVPASGAAMLYATGGLDFLDRPIVPLRPSARPVLAAPAMGGVAWGSPVGSTCTASRTPLTGTSVSTALIGGTAATVWAYDPTLTPSGVMKKLVDGAVPLTPSVPISASAARHFGKASAHRVSLCKTLGAPCPSGVVGATNPALTGVVIPGVPLTQAFSPATAPSCTSLPANNPGRVEPEPNNPRCPQCVLQLDYGSQSQPALVGTILGASTLSCLALFVQDGAGATTVFNLTPSAFANTPQAPTAARLTTSVVPTTSSRAWLVWEQPDPAQPQQNVTVGQAIYVMR
jgi:hypothetical protein